MLFERPRTRINVYTQEHPRTIVVGDVHAHKNALVELLCTHFKYDVNHRGTWIAPKDTHLVLDGDIINRGPDTPGMVVVARQLQEQRIATIVRGNHEHEAVTMEAYMQGKRDYPHWIPQERQMLKQEYHQKFRASYGGHHSQMEGDVAWMETLPFAYETASIRVAHASFVRHNVDALHMAAHDPYDKTLPRAMEQAAYETAMGHLFSLDHVLEIAPDLAEHDRRIFAGGVTYDKALVKSWVQPQAFYQNLADVLLLQEHHPLTQLDIRSEASQNFMRTHFGQHDTDPRPLLLGHYGLKGEPRIQHDCAAVLDFKGFITAYDYEAGETVLHNDRIRAIPV